MWRKNCHNCGGTGLVAEGRKCLYCRGKGYRFSDYGIDPVAKREDELIIETDENGNTVCHVRRFEERGVPI